MQANYDYDSNDNIVNETVYQGNSSNLISYIWDNDRLVGYKNIIKYYSVDPLSDPLLFAASYDFDKTIQTKIHYDENNSPYAVTIDGVDYYYVKNAAGNIKGLVNASTGEEVLSINTSAYGKVSFTYTNSICNEYNLGAVTGYSDFDTARIIQEIVNTLIFACVNFNGFHYDPYTKLYYAKDKIYDPEICRYLNAVDPGDLITKRTPIINSLAIDTPTVNTSVNNTTFDNGLLQSTPTVNTPLNNTLSNNTAIRRTPIVNTHLNNNSRSFSTNWISYPIDATLAILCPSLSWPYDILGNTVRSLLKKFGLKNVAQFLLTTAIPKFKGMFSNGFTFIRTAIWRITGFIISQLLLKRLEGAIIRITNILQSQYLKQAYICISSFFSAGAFIAGVLDFATDGVFDNTIVIRT